MSDGEGGMEFKERALTGQLLYQKMPGQSL
jgi:hypothetical protein